MDDFASTLRRGLVGSPRLRRGVAALGSGRAAEVANQLSDIDPKRFRSLYKDRTRQILENESKAKAAVGAPYGSIAAAQDPNRVGSVASNQFKTLYRG